MQKHFSSSDDGPVFDVVWPLGRTVVESIASTTIVSDLNGKTVGELWDWVFRGDEIFPLLRERLRQRFPRVKFVEYSQFGSIHGLGGPGVQKSLPERFRALGCDVVISGVGA